MSIFNKTILAGIGFYRKFISSSLPPRCRFYPSCSSFAEKAIEKHGLFRGVALTVKRLAKCHPWHHGGVDPVP